MTTTPKGFTELTNASAMSGPEQINAAERLVEDLIDKTVPTVADLAPLATWSGRQVRVEAGYILYVWMGSWKPVSSDWITYTPTLTGITLGAGGTATARYKYVSGRVCVKWSLTFGTSPTVSSTAAISLPFPFAFDVPRYAWVAGRASGYDVSTGGTSFELTQRGNASDASSIAISAYNGTISSLSSTNPLPWAVGDIMAGSLVGDLS